jgi:C4-type Zn-finger protein
VTIGPTCPICEIKDPAREHVSRHFMNELMESVADLDDPLQCPECSYRGEKSQNVARHIALVHSRLDALLANDQLVETRRQQFMSRPNKINIGAECPVCDQQLTKQHSRVHVIWHFIEELREIVHTFADPTVIFF